MKYAFPNALNENAKALIDLCRDKNVRLSTIESCTGGLLAGCLTDIAGSSDVMDRGFVTYSNEAKNEEVGVKLETLMEFGAVSAPVAKQMCAGAMARRPIGAAASLTGVAGPGGARPTNRWVLFISASRRAIANQSRIATSSMAIDKTCGLPLSEKQLNCLSRQYP